jgi:hypothetical protein
LLQPCIGGFGRLEPKGLELKESMMAKLTEQQRDSLAPSQFAFEKQRKEPLENASHVRNAVARFNQVEGVTDA